MSLSQQYLCAGRAQSLELGSGSAGKSSAGPFTGILPQRLVAHAMQAVLDGPVPAAYLKQPARIRPLGPEGC